MQVLFEPSWGILELELASVMHRTIKSYGALYTHQDPSNLYKPVPLVSPSPLISVCHQPLLPATNSRQPFCMSPDLCNCWHAVFEPW